jgi:hypothetical protein
VWLKAVLEELKGSRVQDPVLQGQFMRQMIFGPLHFRLLQQIQELPNVRAAVNAGSATFEHYAAAIIATTVLSSKAITRPLGLSYDRGSGLSTLSSAPSWHFGLLPLTAASRPPPVASGQSSAS